jgi:iron complex outermembrane receptor protein
MLVTTPRNILENIKSVLFCGCILFAVSAVNPAAAQQDEDEAIEEVVVTGTRMRGAEAPVGSAVISIDREYIDQSNAVSVDQLIKEIPQTYNMGVTEASRGQPGGNGNIVYGNSVNVRGIGPFSTLVLIDGHRVVTNSRNVDPSILPTLAIARVEVVADGASAVYGSDAIAGVVNLVQRRYVDGGQVTAHYGNGDEYDEHRIGISWGTTWDRGQFFAAYENGSRADLNGFDRPYFRALQPEGDFRTPLCDPGNIVVGGVSYAIPEGGVDASNVGSLQADTQNLCESLENQDLLPQQDYNTASFTFNYKFTDETEVYLDGYYGKREFERATAYFSGALTVPDTNAFFVDPSGTAPASITVNYNFRNDLPTDDSAGHARSWGLTTGLKQDLPGDWTFDALVSYGENNEVSQTWRGLDSRGSLPAALASSDPATAFDPFGLHRTSATVLAEISDQIFLTDNNVDFTGIEASFNGPLIDLPGGTMQLAVGYERQELTGFPLLARGNPGTDYRCVPCGVASVSDLQRTVNSYYAELLVPVIGDNSTSGQSLDFRAAVRYDDYSDVGSTTNPQFGLSWSPTDQISVRASYGESFRAPLFSDLFGNSSAMFVEAFVDPTIGGAPRQGVFQSGGNPDLVPESATTWSFGADFNIPWLESTTISLTYFNIDYENQIAQYLGDRNILQRESEFAGTGIILRDQAAADRIDELFAQGLNVARGVLPDPVTLYVDGRPNNLGRSETKGLDFALRTAWSTEGGSEWFADFSGVYTLDHKVSITPTGTLLDKDNQIFNPLKLRARAALSWQLGRYSARAVANLIGSYKNTLASPTQDVDAFTPIDLSAWMELGETDGTGWGDRWVVGAEISNVFDEDPPYVNIAPSGNGSGGFDATAANPVGRLYSVSVRKSF